MSLSKLSSLDSWSSRRTNVNTEAHQLSIGGLQVAVVRKPIKNLHLGVYPPNGRVRVAAPLRVSDDAVRLAVIGKLGWIKRQRARFAAQDRQPPRAMLSGETHYVFGRRYRLRAIEGAGTASVTLGKTTLQMRVPPRTNTPRRQLLLQRWYRAQLKLLIPRLLAKWEPKLGVQAAAWGVKRMKTRWGSCSRASRRIWLNLELAKKPVACLEYIVVHELAHLIERRHNDRFIRILDEHLPRWRTQREELNSAPLAHEEWTY
jgi:predicted metal-dependent hydrolase